MPSPSASAAASSANSFRPGIRARQGRPAARLWTEPWTTLVPKPPANGRTEHPKAVWLKALGRYPHSVEIPLSRDAHNPVENGECVGFYQTLTLPTVAART